MSGGKRVGDDGILARHSGGTRGGRWSRAHFLEVQVFDVNDVNDG